MSDDEKALVDAMRAAFDALGHSYECSSCEAAKKILSDAAWDFLYVKRRDKK